MSDTQDTNEEKDDSATDLPDHARQQLKGVFREALDEFIAENAPDPKRTKQPENWFNSITGFGR